MIKLQYCDPTCVLIINPTGRIRKLYTPFRVVCIKSSGSIRVKTSVYVDEVGATDKDELIYIISGSAHYHSCFRIEAKF